MALTPEQQTVLKTHIEANTDPVIVQALLDGASSLIAAEYNKLASPDYYCWRTSMLVAEIRELVDWDEVVSRTTNDLLAFQILTSTNSVNPSNASVRQAFTSIFSGGQGVNSRTALANAAKTTVSLVEKVLALQSAVGDSDNPDNFGFEGIIGHTEISKALING